MLLLRGEPPRRWNGWSSRARLRPGRRRRAGRPRGGRRDHRRQPADRPDPGACRTGGTLRASACWRSAAAASASPSASATVRLRAGDVMVLRSASPRLPDILGELHILPLAEPRISLGRSKRSLVPVAVLAVAMALVALHVLAGRRRLLRRRRDPAAAAGDDDARGLRDGGMARADPARRADPGQPRACVTPAAPT